MEWTRPYCGVTHKDFSFFGIKFRATINMYSSGDCWYGISHENKFSYVRTGFAKNIDDAVAVVDKFINKLFKLEESL